MNRKTIITLAVASTLAAPVSAMIDEEGGTVPSGGSAGYVDGGTGWGGAGAVGVGMAELPPVEVICSRIKCNSLTISVNNYGVYTVTRSTIPFPNDPDGKMGDPKNPPPQTPEDREKKKQQCIADCDVKNKVQLNTCKVNNVALRDNLAKRPGWAALGGAIAGFIASKTGGALVGGPFTFELVKATNEKMANDALNRCEANAAFDHSDCLIGVCHAWLSLPLLLVPAARRRREMAYSDKARRGLRLAWNSLRSPPRSKVPRKVPRTAVVVSKC